MQDNPFHADVVEVPTSVRFPDVWLFALTYDGYGHHGHDAGNIGNAAVAAWRSSRALPDDLDAARTALFFEQRRWHHFGTSPDERTIAYLAALLDRIHELSGGQVRNDRPVL